MFVAKRTLALFHLRGEILKTLILGAGAMGCLFGAKLKQAGFDVTLYNRENETMKRIEKEGIQLISSDETKHTIQIPVIYDSSELKKEYDLILVLVKAYATEAVLTDVYPIIGEKTIVLSLQNGVGNLEKMEKVIPQAVLGVGGTGSGASVLSPGVIAHRATGRTNIGFVRNNDSEEYEKISDMLTASGLETAVTQNVQSVIWSKLMINVAFNSLTAISSLKNGDAILPQAGEAIVKSLIEEAAVVAAAEGIELLYDYPVEEILEIGRGQIARNQSSMLTDVLNERKTEIEVINGAIVTYGKKHDIETPYNQLVTHLIHLIEESYSKRI